MSPIRASALAILTLVGSSSGILAGEPSPLSLTSVADRGALVLDVPLSARFAFGGRLGERIDRNLRRWILIAPTANPGMLEMFRLRDRLPPPQIVPWAGEFAGKYLISAVQALRMTERDDARRFVAKFVRELIATQASDGYLGPFRREERLLGHWDLWGHYHVMTGLLDWYDASGDTAARDAALRAADLMVMTFLDTDRRVFDAGSPEMNMAVVHVLGRVYRLTGRTPYLRLALEVTKDWERAGDYFRQGLAGIEFYRTPRPRWESLHSVQGLVELWRITGEERYRTAFVNLWRSIARRDRHNTGGFSSGERAVGHPWSPAPIETCCTVAWTALTLDMLRVSGESTAADELELSTYNGVAGAQHPSGRWWTYDTPMDGIREASAHAIVFQARAGTPELNCCSVNAPRGLGILSQWAVMTRAGGVAVHYYGPSTISCALADGTELVLEQDAERTDYPLGGAVLLKVSPATPTEFTLALRIPRWSERTTVRINGTPVDGVRPGRHLEIRRQWQRGDEVSLVFDMRLRTWSGDREAAGAVSVFRGPLLLAWDQRWNSFDEDVIPPLDTRRLREFRFETQRSPAGAELDPWLLARIEVADGRELTLCDFATAGATGTRYRTWLRALGAPPPPVLLDRPLAGQTVAPGRTVFRWSGLIPVPPDATFRLVVSEREDFSAPVVRETLSRRIAVPAVHFAAGHTYFWKVISVTATGETESEPRFFTIDGGLQPLADAELDALLPSSDGLLLLAPLRGDPAPARGVLEDSRAATACDGPLGSAGGAIRLDGETGRVRYSLFEFPHEDYTAHLWIRIHSFPDGRLGEVLSAWAAGMDDPLRICIEDDKLFARIEAGRGYSTTGVAVETGRWMHVAAVKHQGELRLYIDGVQVAEGPAPISIPSAARNLALGANPNLNGNEYLAVSVSRLHLYTRALTPEEIERAARRTR